MHEKGIEQHWYPICTCGHPLLGHRQGRCLEPHRTCRCSYGQSFFDASDFACFLLPHQSSVTGHALTAAIFLHTWKGGVLRLSGSALGRDPKCHRCKTRTSDLMPVLSTFRGLQLTTEIEKGRMTRMICRDCVEGSGLEFSDFVAQAINSCLEQRQLPRTP